MSIIGDKEIRVYENIVGIYRELQDLMGNICGAQVLSKEASLEHLEYISNMVLNTKEGYVAVHMENTEAGVCDGFGNIHRELQDLMGNIYGAQELPIEASLDHLGHISNMVLNTKEGYVTVHMGEDTTLLGFIDSERQALNQALRSTNGRFQSH